MMRNFKNAIVGASALVVAAGATPAFAGEITAVGVLAANQAQHVNLGSKKALGYYGKRNGKCDLTVMVVENPLAQAADTSAARVKVSVTPGTSARVASSEGRSVEFFCGPQARRMLVKSFGPEATPRS